MHRFEIENWGIVESINNPFIDFFFKKTNKIDKTLEINKNMNSATVRYLSIDAG